MSVEFRCANPQCHKLLTGPDDWTGRQIHCPLCGTAQPVPAPQESDTIPLADDPPAAGQAQVVCVECGQSSPLTAVACSLCGRPLRRAATTPPPQTRPPTPAPMPRPTGQPNILVDGLRSVVYAMGNRSSIFKLTAVFAGVYIAYQFGFTLLLVWARGSLGGQIVVLLVALCASVLMGGYLLRFYLDCAIGGLEAAEQAPDIPPFDMDELIRTGLKGLAMVVVYVVPVVTIPLLPVGYLALAYTNDHRALNPLRAARAAAKCPGGLAAVWLVLILLVLLAASLLFLVVMAASVLVGVLPGGVGLFKLVVLVILTGFLAASVAVTFYCMCFHCFGVLGRHRPAVLEVMSEPGIPAVSGGFIAGGAVLAIVGLVIAAPRPKPTVSQGGADYEQRRRARLYRNLDREDGIPGDVRRRLKKLELGLNLYMDQYREYPASLNELVTAGFVQPGDTRVDDRSFKLFGYIPSAHGRSAILLYHPDTESDGRRVVLLNGGIIKKVGPDEFQERVPKKVGPAGFQERVRTR